MMKHILDARTNRILYRILPILTSFLLSFTHSGDHPKKPEHPQEHLKAVSAPKFPGRPLTNDPIRFTLKADKQQVAVGEPLTITIVAHYLNISPSLMFTTAGSNAFRLRVLFPEGFVQTGGDYVDYVGTELSAAKPTVTYTLKGYFTKTGSKNEFRLLRGHALADASSLFVDKSRLGITVIDNDVARPGKGARSAGALAFQIVSYDCNSGVLQYQFIGGDGSPINVVLPGIFAGTMYTDNVATYTFPGDARQGRSMSGNANQSGNQISINFTTSCNLTSGGGNPPTTPNPPSNPNPPSGGGLAFQIVGYDCNSGVLQYQMTGGDGSPINLTLPGIFAGTVNANNVATHTFPGDARQGRAVSGYASQSGNQISISFTTGCNLTTGATTPPPPSNPPSNPTPPSGNCGFTEGQFLFSFYSEQIYAHSYNGTWFATYQDASQGFKPQHWLQAAGFDPSRVSCFAENDPRNGNTSNPQDNCFVNTPRGNVDDLNSDGIRGWALDESDLNKTVTVDIYVNGIKVASGKANEDRPDLIGAFGNNASVRYHGFQAQWSYNRSGTNTYTITAKICGTNTVLATRQITFQNSSSTGGRQEPTPTGIVLAEVTVVGTSPNGSGNANWIGWVGGFNSNGGNTGTGGSNDGSGSNGGGGGSSGGGANQTSSYSNKGGTKPYSAQPTSTTNPSSLTNPRDGETYTDSEGNIIVYSESLGGWVLPEALISPYDKEASINLPIP